GRAARSAGRAGSPAAPPASSRSASPAPAPPCHSLRGDPYSHDPPRSPPRQGAVPVTHPAQPVMSQDEAAPPLTLLPFSSLTAPPCWCTMTLLHLSGRRMGS